ncbi:V-type proton ATPase subunit S1-like protein isoform X2 [Hyla sarda]|uniref:V-type proton ATPase subunit S1-like protein isoform X2 n=1 Tax=Hyla sarda TaxID=327740 RepID=UPI0024C3381D|nr:V-type proton ATPase subunit S1-like protein isoform X2 [Hyla sarda]
MEKKRFCFIVAIIGMGIVRSKEWVSAGQENRYNLQTSSGKELVQSFGFPNRFSTQDTLLQTENQDLYYNIVRKETMSREVTHESNLPPQSNMNVTKNGSTCILFGAKRIIIRFKNQTQLDLTNTNISLHDNMDVEESNCNEENSTLTLKFIKVGLLKGLALRFLLVKSYYKLSVQNWYKLQSVQILLNHSVQATFNTSRIFAPISYSYHCKHVSSLQKHDALLVPSSAENSSRLWDVTFQDFQIQGFNVEDGEFAYAKDCATYFSPAILMGLVMSLILLLVLAYALHMLLHLKSMDRHYQRKCSATYFPKMKDSYLEDEREPLRGCGQEFYELKQPEYCRLSIQQCASVSH